MNICKDCGKKILWKRSQCKVCYDKEYRKNNKKRIIERDKTYYYANQKIILEKKRLDRLHNPEYHTEVNKRWYAKNGKKYYAREDVKYKQECRKLAEELIPLTKCCVCETVEKLERHHSKGYKLGSIEGVVVICRDCHALIHRNKRFGDL